MTTRARPPIVTRWLAAAAIGAGSTLFAACTTGGASTALPRGRIQPATPSLSMTTLGVSAAETGTATMTPGGGPDDARLAAPTRRPKEVARTVLSQHSTQSESEVDSGASSTPVHLVAEVRCVGVGGATSATLLVTTSTYSVLGAPDQSQVLARRQVSCDGRVLRLNLGAALKGAAGVVLVDPADERLRGYALLVRS